MRCIFLSACLAAVAVLPANLSCAQVTPDGTLGTIVTSVGNDFTITNGTAKGNNLFHSFQRFGIPTSGSATFDLVNTPNISTIFSRVTGGGVSNIDGAIRTLNGSNPVSLFLLNPNGILFGPNASLNIGGSFVGTTASSIKFADGTEFSATNPTATSLLTVSVPIGLQFGLQTGQTSGSIQVQGAGYNLLQPGSFFNPATRNSQLPGLQVNPGQTLALIGNNLILGGGVLRAESGSIELGSLSTGTVALNHTNPANWTFTYNSISQFADIDFTRAALIDASGNPGGSIQLQGKTIRVQNSSVIAVQHQGPAAAGLIQVKADLLELSGVLPGKDTSLILSENLGSGLGGNIEVSARQIVMRDGGKLTTTTFRNGGSGGNVAMTATESIQLLGYSPFNPTETSGITTPSNRGGGTGGNIFISAPTLRVENGAAIASGVFGGAGGGTLQIYSDDIVLIGENKGTAGGSVIASTTFFGGNAGAIDIQTGQLLIRTGGVISASTSGVGSGGSLTIQARNTIEIDGAGSVLSQPSRITASGQTPPGRFQQLFGIDALPSGNAGNLSIASPMIQVRNQGYVAAENVGSGDAGRLTLNADTIVLDQQGQIRTSTTSGQGGNLDLNVRGLLLLRHQSLISARAGRLGNGGNIEIAAPIVAGFENSDIIANAFQGRGGKVQISTQGIFGLKFRSQLTPDNDITATSEFGVTGTVQVETLGVDPSAGLIQLPVNLADPSRQIVAGCGTNDDSSFVVTGRGGIPDNPTQPLRSDHPWADTRDLSEFRTATPVRPAARSITPPPIVEASILRQTNGQLELVATNSPASLPQVATCARAIDSLP